MRDPTGSQALSDAAAGPLGVSTRLWAISGAKNPSPGERFVKLLDLQEGNDRVSWRALLNWSSDDGAVLLEEEQAVTVHSVDSGDKYSVDLDWTLRAGDKPVAVTQTDGGGLRAAVGPQVKAANANFDRNMGIRPGDSAAPMTASFEFPVSRAGKTVSGINVSGDVSEPGFPAVWQVTSPFPGHNVWSISARQEATFHFHLIIHNGPGDGGSVPSLQGKP
jgi:hypothetical protein